MEESFEINAASKAAQVGTASGKYSSSLDDEEAYFASLLDEDWDDEDEPINPTTAMYKRDEKFPFFGLLTELSQQIKGYYFMSFQFDRRQNMPCIKESFGDFHHSLYSVFSVIDQYCEETGPVVGSVNNTYRLAFVKHAEIYLSVYVLALTPFKSNLNNPELQRRICTAVSDTGNIFMVHSLLNIDYSGTEVQRIVTEHLAPANIDDCFDNIQICNDISEDFTPYVKRYNT
jgi:hypothetical protein